MFSDLMMFKITKSHNKLKSKQDFLPNLVAVAR